MPSISSAVRARLTLAGEPSTMDPSGTTMPLVTSAPAPTMQSRPITMGGGTYAKGIHNCIAFGCEFEGEDCHIHDANEFVRVQCLLDQAEIYVHALIKLLEV